MTHANIRSLQARGAAIREQLERAGFDVQPTLIDNGAWGRLDLAVTHPHQAGSGKVQVHCSAKGKMSVVPQGALASGLATAIGMNTRATATAPAAPPRPQARATARGTATRKSGATPKLHRSAPEGTLVVDCSKTGDALLGPTEWRGVIRQGGEWRDAFGSPLFERGHNNIGEFLALVDALRRIEAGALPVTALYSDSRTALAWLRNRKLKSKFDPEEDFDARFAAALRDAMLWLRALGTKPLPIVPQLWPTAEWGDIPADFGRK